MAVAIVTGSAGLVGAAAVRKFAAQGLDVVGIDNDLRRHFFGEAASTAWNRQVLEREIPAYRHVSADIRDADAIDRVFADHAGSIKAIVHAAAQPSHDWAARDPIMDFSVNANGTLVLLEATRKHAPDAAFVFLSTNKVYGDTPNDLPLVEQEMRFELDPAHPYARHGIDEHMSIDGTLHSLFGVSKAAADLLVQEYGRYFGLRTACFRGGCLTGADHSGAELHGFLAYLMRCAVTDKPYTVFGHKAKQVRDNIHADDLAAALWAFVERPRPASVYNIGGGRHANCSMLEAIAGCERRTGRPMRWSYSDDARTGDHIWWVSDTRRFQADFPDWRYRYDLDGILDQMHAAVERRLAHDAA
ncbi:CDP-paratose 2-epimerase [Stella humosa]|uniref:CDP-paratose 2-epimerase n=1 Tax=Stella humosa TaxID=94 RepID=A0A3N1M8A1_9PROT|nr:NAD-dependent epimerase/dehydratase family protein [Stella humosa]ROP99942.1 CDP-paratose 2-epimerase [Stella humosa]BBK30828.1 NAD-dependent epimerase [Stella humosa]